MFKIIFTKPFLKKVSQVTKNNENLQKNLKKGIKLLSRNPFDASLKTHKAGTKKYGKRYSSSVTGDLRIIWDYGDEELTIIALDFGGHSGGNRVYK